MASCAHCNTRNVPYRCMACNHASYCDAECQRQDWQLHAQLCNLKIDDYDKEDKGDLLMFVYGSTGPIDSRNRAYIYKLVRNGLTTLLDHLIDNQRITTDQIPSNVARDIETISWLADHNVDLNTENTNDDCLLSSLLTNVNIPLDILKYAVSKGADPRKNNVLSLHDLDKIKTRNMVLFLEKLKYLLDIGARPDDTAYDMGVLGYLVTNYSRYKYERLIPLLLHYDVPLYKYNTFSALSETVGRNDTDDRFWFILNILDTYMLTPEDREYIYSSAFYHSPSLKQAWILIQHGANVNYTNGHYQAFYAILINSRADRSIVDLMAKYGAKLDMNMLPATIYGYTPFHAKLLLLHGVPPGRITNDPKYYSTLVQYGLQVPNADHISDLANANLFLTGMNLHVDEITSQLITYMPGTNAWMDRWLSTDERSESLLYTGAQFLYGQIVDHIQAQGWNRLVDPEFVNSLKLFQDKMKEFAKLTEYIYPKIQVLKLKAEEEDRKRVYEMDVDDDDGKKTKRSKRVEALMRLKARMYK
jgi:hypothetical protein